MQKKIASPSNTSKSQIMDYDKLYHNILVEWWYKWSFWEILKKNPKQISNIQKIWELHKMRNKIAHDLNEIDERVMLTKSKEFEKEISNLLGRF